MRAWPWMVVLLAGCVGDAGRPSLDGLVADTLTTNVALAWMPEAAGTDTGVQPPMTPRGEVPIGEDRRFDPAELLANIGDDPPSHDCAAGLLEQAVELAGFVCEGDGNEPPPVRLGLARILGFSERPVDTTPTEGFPPSQSVSDTVEVVWSSEPVTRSSPAWVAFQAELPGGAVLVRRRACPQAVDPCHTCWPFVEPPHCIEPVGSRELVLLRPWPEGSGGP